VKRVSRRRFVTNGIARDPVHGVSLSLSLTREFRLSNSDAAAPVHDPATTRAHVYLTGVNREKYVLARARESRQRIFLSSPFPFLFPRSLGSPCALIKCCYYWAQTRDFSLSGLNSESGDLLFSGIRARTSSLDCILLYHE